MKEWLHSAKGRIGERAAQAFSCVAALIQMMLVEEGVELSMEGLDLSFRRTAEEAMALSELQ